MEYIVTIKVIHGAEASSRVEANNEEEAFALGLHKIKKGGFAKYLPMNPRAYARIVPAIAENILRINK